MHKLRTRLAQMGGQMPIVRTMEHLCGASGEKGIARGKTWGGIGRTNQEPTIDFKQHRRRRRATHRYA